MLQKIFYTLFCCVILTVIGGCKDENYLNRIPASVPVSLRLNRFTTARDLVAVLGHMEFVMPLALPKGYPYTASDATGYGGILVVNGVENLLYAFDLTCPVEVDVNIRIGVVDNGMNAVCPKCGSKFEIATGSGSPMSGTAKTNRYFLQRYYVHSAGNEIFYVNRYN